MGAAVLLAHVPLAERPSPAIVTAGPSVEASGNGRAPAARILPLAHAPLAEKPGAALVRAQAPAPPDVVREVRREVRREVQRGVQRTVIRDVVRVSHDEQRGSTTP
jgi:hypothetical protein